MPIKSSDSLSACVKFVIHVENKDLKIGIRIYIYIFYIGQENCNINQIKPVIV